MAKHHGPSIKDDTLYEHLRADGAPPAKAARIANAKAAGTIDHRGGGTLEDRTKKDLLDEARKIGIPGRSTMTKDELVEAIRTG